jgi:ABC-2 type transport system ATP-binding protein
MKISFQNISKQYKGKYALKNFTTESQEGVYGLLGVNSTGKTTLINIFVGTLGSDNGTVLIDGQEAKTLGKEFLSKIGYMMQYSIFYRDFTVMDFLLYMCTLKGISDEQGKGRSLELLGIVNLLDAKDKKIGVLSGGMRQRAGIVQAMLGDPKILILDEPTGEEKVYEE